MRGGGGEFLRLWMDIAGLQKCSLIDYPGEVSAVVFTRGCNFRCLYCYNSELVLPDKYAPLISEDEIFSFLSKRAGRLDAVVITGGEPCMQEDLKDFVQKVKGMGFKVKLDTNGSFPEVLENLLPCLDYVAVDVKAPFDKYPEIAKADAGRLLESLRLVKGSGKDYEFRTTVFRGCFSEEDIEEIGKMAEGTKKHYIQNYLPSEKVLSQGLQSCSEEELEGYRKKLEGFVGECRVR